MQDNETGFAYYSKDKQSKQANLIFYLALINTATKCFTEYTKEEVWRIMYKNKGHKVFKSQNIKIEKRPKAKSEDKDAF